MSARAIRAGLQAGAQAGEIGVAGWQTGAVGGGAEVAQGFERAQQNVQRRAAGGQAAGMAGVQARGPAPR